MEPIFLEELAQPGECNLALAVSAFAYCTLSCVKQRWSARAYAGVVFEGFPRHDVTARVIRIRVPLNVLLGVSTSAIETPLLGFPDRDPPDCLQDAIVDSVCQGGSLATALRGTAPFEASVLIGGLPGERQPANSAPSLLLQPRAISWWRSLNVPVPSSHIMPE